MLIFVGKKTPYYVKSALFGDYFSTKTHEMGEIIFQSPLFEVFPSSQSSLFRNFQIHFVFKALSKLKGNKYLSAGMHHIFFVQKEND